MALSFLIALHVFNTYNHTALTVKFTQEIKDMKLNHIRYGSGVPLLLIHVLAVHGNRGCRCWKSFRPTAK